MNRKIIPQDTIVAFGGVGFTLLITWLIWAMAPLLKDVPHLADSGASWYWWQLPERTTMGIFSAWFFLCSVPTYYVGIDFLRPTEPTQIWAHTARN